MKLEAMVVMLAIGTMLGCATEGQQERRSSTTASSSAGETPSPEQGVTPEQNDAIDALFRRKAPELQTCWNDEYEKTHDRKLEGDVTLGMTVTPSGKPADVKVLNSTIKNGDIEVCVRKAVGQWDFPEVSAPVPYMRTVHLGAEF